MEKKEFTRYREEAKRLLGMINKESSKEEVLAVLREAEELGIALGPVLRSISETLLGDKEVVLEAMKHNVHQFKYASPELQRDEQFVKDVRRTLGEEIQRTRQADGYPLLTKEELDEMIGRFLKVGDVQQEPLKKLQSRETTLSKLETEARTISEAEALIDQQREGQNIGE